MQPCMPPAVSMNHSAKAHKTLPARQHQEARQRLFLSVRKLSAAHGRECSVDASKPSTEASKRLLLCAHCICAFYNKALAGAVLTRRYDLPRYMTLSKTHNLRKLALTQEEHKKSSHACMYLIFYACESILRWSFTIDLSRRQIQLLVIYLDAQPGVCQGLDKISHICSADICFSSAG